ncbi:EF-hand domain-containing protein [Salinicola sp. LHM]|uniref:EF-hand domain-containing protein n=1 Tax=Salinicola sp. LHM TaxID=3065298 RepID=UPI002ACE35FF|nr:EF-hand domain-containing protein [Salinicola sp. LHM]WQH33854.1 EF-hand domain-containing protein [Salinicola sp. LHM]
MFLSTKSITTGLFSFTALVALAGCQNYTPAGDGAGSFERGKLEMSAPPELVDRFHSLDSDGDGVIDVSEARSDSDLMGAFGTADIDSDRQLSLGEFLNSQAVDNN